LEVLLRATPKVPQGRFSVPHFLKFTLKGLQGSGLARELGVPGQYSIYNAAGSVDVHDTNVGVRLGSLDIETGEIRECKYYDSFLCLFNLVAHMDRGT
jgi:hypothetical protein